MQELNLNKPISQSQFYGLSMDNQVKYIDSLVNRFSASGTMIADMLNMSGLTLRNHMATLGYHFHKGGRRSSEQLDEWEIFCRDDESKEISNGPVVFIDNTETSEEEPKVADSKVDDSIESMKIFVEECCKINDEMNTRVDIFIQVYLAWCRDNDFPPMKKEDIIRFITSEYNTVFPKRKGHVYCNICLSYDKFQLYKNKIKYHDGEDRRTINPYMTFSRDNNDNTKSNNVKTDTKKVEPKVETKVETKTETIVSKEETKKNIKMTSASGIFLFEGNGGDIFTDLAERFKENNLKVKVSWEFII